MQQTITVSDFNGFVENHNEPAWLVEYRKKNFAVFTQRPLKKSQYIDVEKLEQLLKVTKTQNSLPKTEGKNAQVFSFTDAL
mgnify:CR=1 FL=1